MTQVQGKFVALPPVFEAIQWDGTLDGSLEIFDFINERTEPKDFARPINFTTRVYGRDEDRPDARIVLERDVIPEDDSNARTMWPTSWLVYCARPKSWEIMSPDRFRENYGMVNEDA